MEDKYKIVVDTGLHFSHPSEIQNMINFYYEEDGWELVQILPLYGTSTCWIILKRKDDK